MPEAGLAVTDLRPGEEEALNALYNETFNFSRSLDVWRWKFHKVPLAGLVVIRCLRRRGELVGHGASLPVRFRIRGRKVVAGQMVDFGVKPTVRFDVSLYRLNRALLKNLRETWIGQGMPFVYGFPNEPAYRFHKRIAGARDFLWIPVWTRWVNPCGRFLGRVRSRSFLAAGRFMVRGLRSAAGRVVRTGIAGRPPVRFFPLPEPDEKLDRLWEQAASAYGILSWRDRSQLAWRYFEKPGRPYVVWLLADGPGPRGYAVTTVREEDDVRVGYIVDVFGESGAMRRLVNGAVDRLALSGCDLVRCLAVEPSILGQTLAGGGFRKEPQHVPLIGLLFDPAFERGFFFDDRNWHVTYGDFDGV